MTERESKSSIGCLKTIREVTFNSHEFRNFCEENVMKRQHTATYTPQQNGGTERKNKILMNMLAWRGISKSFWLKVMIWESYVKNISPTIFIPNITSKEFRIKSKPSVQHFRIFYIAYAHIPHAQRRKLNQKNMKCIFLGVGDTYKAYRLYNHISKKIIITRDVVFVENGR